MMALRRARGLIACAAIVFVLPAAALEPRDLLDPQDAFRLTAVALDARSAQVEFRIAEGYYLYRLARARVRLKVVSQGCSDSGVCYVPQEQWVEVSLGGLR